MADRAVRPTRLKDFPPADSPTKQTIGMFSRTSTFTMSTGGNHN
nr:MAG TPA: hypothetical protein [Caudoviricetes sp.]